MKTLAQIKRDLIEQHSVQDNDIHNAEVVKWATDEAKRLFDAQPKPVEKRK